MHVDRLKDAAEDSDKVANDVKVALDHKVAVIRDLRLEMRKVRVASKGQRTENERRQVSLMNKEQDLPNDFARPTVAIGLDALREAKRFADNARRVSDASKGTDPQERDEEVSAQEVSVLEKDKAFTKVRDRSR